MKAKKLYFLPLLLSVSTILVIASCDHAKQREAKIDPAIANDIILISDLKDISSAQNSAYFISATENIELKKNDSTEQIQINAAIKNLRSKITDQKIAADFDDALKIDAVAVTIEDGKILIMRTVTDDKLIISENATFQKNKSKKIGFLEITSIKIDRSGILDNARTDYDEKKSILTLIDKPIEESTHILVTGAVEN
ncbi:MAG: hypothetical protein WA160_01605 [Pseudobdellovibrio sp.]